METSTEICRELLYDFLNRWDIDTVKNMKLSAYVSVGDKDTFCQWLENRTKALGSIRGINSSKFGIYKRGDAKKRPKRLISDSQYSWQKYYGVKNRNEAFSNIKKEILKIIEYSIAGQFEQIDNLHLTQFFRWKIAYLYSNERLIPIFRRDVLVKIAKYYGLNATNKTNISEIQNVMILNKPAHLSIYEYSDLLYSKFGDSKKTRTSKRRGKLQRKSRKPTQSRNTKQQKRKGAESYVANQKHNELQEALYKSLILTYGKKNVTMEEDYIDVKVTLKDKVILYEVKSSAYASDCIREALGQIISYVQRDDNKRKKVLVVAGQYPPNQDEQEYINFIKKNLKIEFHYEDIEL